jgi:hypothetical protein
MFRGHFQNIFTVFSAFRFRVFFRICLQVMYFDVVYVYGFVCRLCISMLRILSNFVQVIDFACNEEIQANGVETISTQTITCTNGYYYKLSNYGVGRYKQNK